jgi:hypothetical protein
MLPLIDSKLAQNGTPKRISRQQKTDNLIKLIFAGHTDFTENAKTLGISRRTVYRYWDRWKQSEEAQQIDSEWWALYNTVKQDNPTKALECMTRIKHRMTTEKLEVNEQVTSKHVEELNVTMRSYEAAVLRIADRYAPKDSPEQQVDSSQPQTTPT